MSVDIDTATRKQAHSAIRRIDEIIIGERHRRDMGDLDRLAASIAELGLLHPIVIRPDNRLIAGERRLRAAQQRGWRDIPVRVVDLDHIARGEYAENAIRKDFTPSEAVAIMRALEPIEREAAQKRMRAGRPSENCSEGRGNALDKIAKATGMHRTTLTKAAAIVDAAEADREKFGKLREDMDRTGRVNGPFKRLNNMRQAEQIRAEPPPLPGNNPYRAGMIDISWAYEVDDDDAPHRGVLPYPTMSIEQACGLDVASRLHKDCIVGMWVTNFVLSRGLHLPVLHAWGKLEAKTVVTWPKDRIGRGHWAKGQTEHLVIATRGKPIVTLGDHTTLLKGPFHLVQKNAHSAKPVEAYIYFESVYPAPRYFDLFSRYRHNERWDCHGDEAPPGDETPPPVDDGFDIPPWLRRAAP
jgi:N6-adenosine-specific RNA methylase IME4